MDGWLKGCFGKEYVTITIGHIHCYIDHKDFHFVLCVCVVNGWNKNVVIEKTKRNFKMV